MPNILDYFIDPVLRGPTLGCMFTSFSISMMGVIVYLRKESLIGESLSHASYPGIILGLCIASMAGYTSLHEFEIRILVILGAFTASLLGYGVIHFLTDKLKIKPDSALCLVLSCFFGWGIALSGVLQSFHAPLFKEVQTYLFGQAAVISDEDAWIYAFFSLINVLFIVFFSKEIQLQTFDKNYAKTLGMPFRGLDSCLFILIAINIVLGMRSVGVVLISALLIAPAVAARQYVKRLSSMFVLAGILGMASGMLGVMLSVEFSNYFSSSMHFALPTGPMIVLVTSLMALISLLFAPERGYLSKIFRICPRHKNPLNPGK